MKKCFIGFLVLLLGVLGSTGCGSEENTNIVPKNLKITQICLMDTESNPYWFSDEENINKIIHILEQAKKMDVDMPEIESSDEVGWITGYSDETDATNAFLYLYYEMNGITYLLDENDTVYVLKHKGKYKKEEKYLEKLIETLPVPTPNPEDELKEYPCGMEEEYVAVTKEELPEVLPLEEASVYQDLKLLPQEIQNMLYNNGTFFEVYNQKEYTRDTFDGSHYMNLEPFERPDWLEYIVFDFDHDDEKELAVVLKSPSIAATVEIFDLQEEIVYAYPVVYRGFLRPQTDGSVTGSSGASQNIQYYFEFNKNHVKNKIIDQQDVSEYQICTEEVSEEEYYQYVSDRYQNGIPWSSDTLDAVLQIFDKW